jgi:hypothetical protein
MDSSEQLNACDCGESGVKVLEAEHRPDPGLDATMVLLDEVVEIRRRA